MTTPIIEQTHAGTRTLLERFDHSRLATVLIFALVAVGFFWMVHYTPLFSDDYLYRIVYGSKDGKVLSSLNDLWTSCYAHYMGFNGRFANVPLCMVLEWIGKPLTDFITTGLFLALGFLCARFITLHEDSNLSLVSVFGIIFLLVDGFSEVFLWLCGSANYLWTIVLGLGFILAFQKLNDGWTPSFPTKFVLLLLALISGWMHEGFSVGICAALVVFYFFKRKEISAFKAIYGLFFLMGTAMNVFAPGTVGRGSGTTGMFSLFQFGLKIAKGFVQVPISVPVLTMLMIAIGICFFRNRMRVKLFIRSNLFLALSILFSIPIPLVFAAYGRGTAFLFVLSMIGLFLFFEKELSVAKIRCVVASFIGLSVAVVFFSVTPDLKQNFELHEKFLNLYEKSESGVVPLDLTSAPKRGNYLSTAFPSDWTRIKDYYGKSEAMILPPNAYENLYLRENFFKPENEVFPGWYSCAGLGYLVRKKNEQATDFVSYSYRANVDKLTIYGKLSAVVLAKLNVLPLSGTLPICGNLHTGGTVVSEWNFPSGTYLTIPRETIRFKIPLEVVSVEKKR